MGTTIIGIVDQRASSPEHISIPLSRSRLIDWGKSRFGIFRYSARDPMAPEHERRAMREENINADRLIAFSDAVFAVIVTVMVLELKAPDEPAFSALWPLWPTAISYAVSYLFIAIIWINHHHLMRFVGPPTLGLIWINFIHLFMVSLLPFATAWVAHPSRVRLCRALRRAVCMH